VSHLISLAQRRSEVSPAEKAAALRPFLRFLDHVGVDGLPLTSAGYLKPDDVRALAAVIPAMADWIGAANRESQTYPVLWFRESVQKLALVRKYRGSLLLTKAGASARGNPDALWRYITSRLPIGKAGSLDLSAGLLVLAFAASTQADYPPLEDIAQALNEVGWRHADGSLVTADDAHWATQDTIGVLQNIATGPQPRRWSERHQFSAVATELARTSLFGSLALTD
jgi:hypothetical protein